MRLFVVGFLLLGLFAATARAQTQQFPYEAVVSADEAYIRSGPGKSYYPTSKLLRNAKVTVHRHDPGGWYMISPPAGSFSYVRADYVRTQGLNRGVLSENNVVVRVGSEFGPVHDVEQRRLSTGDEVEILGEVTLLSDRGPVRMFKINPPRGEYRWVAGQEVVAADAFSGQQRTNPLQPGGRQPYDGNPGTEQKPLDPKYPVAGGTNGLKERPLVHVDDNAAVRRSVPEADRLEEDRERLRILDARFRTIIKADTAEWDFGEIERDYAQLQQQASVPALASQVDLRLQALDRYKTVKREYDDFIRLARETESRDAQLLAIQREERAKATGAPVQTHSPPAPNSSAQPPVSKSPTTPAVPSAGVPRFDGAGIVQRSATTYAGAPRHVLLAPNGRILAYLQGAPGVDLDRHVGQAMGILGPRSYRQDLQNDVIIVRDLRPVRLTP